jgi:hypothetical protein
MVGEQNWTAGEVVVESQTLSAVASALLFPDSPHRPPPMRESRPAQVAGWMNCGQKQSIVMMVVVVDEVGRKRWCVEDG